MIYRKTIFAILALLTIVLAVLKLLEVIHLGWIWVLSPLLIAIVLPTVVLILIAATGGFDN